MSDRLLAIVRGREAVNI